MLCNLNISLLPVKYNLPMICEPVPWEPIDNKIKPTSISDLRGGYLTQPLSDYYHRYRLLSSHDLEHFHIVLGEDYKYLLETMNKLQGQAFEINKDVLDFINKNYNLFVEYGLLMPKELSLLIPSQIIFGEMRDVFMKKKPVNCSYTEVVKEFMVMYQRACYEQFILKLADSLCGYKFYLPAFLDFRGRIYRSGILHFHERDLARSLLLFSNTDQNTIIDNKINNFLIWSAAGFHYNKYQSYVDAAIGLYNDLKQYLSLYNEENYIIPMVKNANDPFQFLSKYLAI